MTDMNELNGQTDGSLALARVLVVHRLGDSWRCVAMARTSATGAAAGRGEGAEVVASRMCATAEEVGALAQEHQIQRVIVILAGGTTVCRTFTLPAMGGELMSEAIDLQAEAALSRGLEDHRRGGAVLPWASDPAAAEFTAVAMGWPGVMDEPQRRLQSFFAASVGKRLDVRFGPVQAALVELLWRTGMVGSGRQSAMAAYFDRAAQCLDVVAAANGRTLFRTVRLGGAAGADQDALDRAALETQVALGLESATAQEWVRAIRRRVDRGASGWVTFPATESPRVRGLNRASSDARWWEEFGLAALAGLGALSGNGGSRRRLYEMQDAPPIADMPGWLRVVDWLARPERAATVAAAALAGVLLFPLAAQGIRYGVLSLKAGDVNALRERTEQLENRVAIFSLMRQQRWPMTKLIADICGATPAGVQISDLRLIQGEEIILKGTSTEYLESVDFVAQLKATKIFEAAAGSSSARESGESGGRYAFDIRARVINAFASSQSVVDYASQTLADRLYGDDDGRAAASRSERPRLRTSRPASETAQRVLNYAGSGDLDFSGPLTEAQIKSLDVAGVSRALAARGSTRYAPESADEQTRARVETEWSGLMAHFDYLRKGGSPIPIPVERPPAPAPTPTEEAAPVEDEPPLFEFEEGSEFSDPENIFGEPDPNQPFFFEDPRPSEDPGSGGGHV